MATDQEKTINSEIGELGRNKYDSTPAEHLQFLLRLKYDVNSKLIQNFMKKHNLCLPETQKLN